MGHASQASGRAEEHWGRAGTKAAFPAFSLFPAGEIAAAPSLSFLSSALAAGCLQPTRFVFRLQSRSPTLPRFCCSFPGHEGAALSLSLFPATGLCIYALPSLISSSLSCFQVLLLSAGRVQYPSGPGASPSCLGVFPHVHVSSHSFIAGHLCPVTPACKPGPGARVEK